MSCILLSLYFQIPGTLRSRVALPAQRPFWLSSRWTSSRRGSRVGGRAWGCRRFRACRLCFWEHGIQLYA